MDVAGQRTFAANFGEVRRLGTRAFDILLAAEEGTAPYPPGMPLSDANARQPLAVAIWIEIRAAHIGFSSLVLSPTQLRGDPVFRQRVPNEPSAQVNAIVTIGERLRADEPDRRETIAQSLFDAGSPQGICDSAVECSLRFDEPTGGGELNAGSRRGTQTPRGVANGTGMAGDLNDSAFGVNAGQRIAALIAP